MSQNVDRASDSGPWGIIPCITPSGTTYLTTRGGPITGPESLALQGIPIDKLSLTYETPKVLQDFAGNAMTSTVVAAAMLAAFGVAHEILEPGAGPAEMPLQRVDISFHELTNDASGTSRTEMLLPVGPIASDTFAQLQILSSRTMQLCSCEGRFGCDPGPFQRCLGCGHTTCTTCGKNPLHNYEPVPNCVSEQRSEPSEFEEKLKNWLPLQLQFEEFTPIPSISESANISDEKRRVVQAIRDAFGHQLHLTSIGRTRSWIATYESSYARLEIIFDRRFIPRSSSSQDLSGFLGPIGVQCYLYAKAAAEEPLNSLVRADLVEPIARMTCKRSIHDGGWEIRLPSPKNFKLAIEYSEEHVDSWEASLNLQERSFKGRQVAQRIRLRCPRSKRPNFCPREIRGVYELLPDCESASGSLYRKLEDVDSISGAMPDPVFFFLDPGLLCNATEDSFVFAATHHRTPLSGARDVLARVGKGIRLPSSTDDVLSCTIPGRWQEYGQTHLGVPTQENVNIRISVPQWTESTVSTLIDITRCTDVDFTALVSSFPLREAQHKQWTRGTRTLLT